MTASGAWGCLRSCRALALPNGMQTRLRRSPRLKAFDYLGPLACSLTLVTRRRVPLFARAGLAEICLGCLRRSSERYKVAVHAYCLMPDHAHLLVEVPE